VQSHPVTARHINNHQVQPEESFLNTKQDIKTKVNSKPKKKKILSDLGLPSDQKTEKIGKRSNNVSICSGFPSQINFKKD